MAVYPERRKGKLTGKWIAEVTHVGRRRRDRFDTKLEAERWADYTKVTGSPPVDPNVVPIVEHSLGDVIKQALQKHSGWEGGRDNSREQRLAHAADVIGRDKSIIAIDTADLDKLVADLKRRPGRKGNRLSPGSINRYLAVVSATLRFAHKRGWRGPLPSFPWQEEDGHRIHWLTDAQEEAVCRALTRRGHTDDALSVRILTRSGLRWGEFEGLEPRQIVLEDVGDAWIKLDKTKTNTPRDVPLERSLAEKLLAMMARNAVPKYHAFRNLLVRISEVAGLKFILTPHMLRHTTATRLVRAGVNLGIVKAFLGHKNLNTTLRYTHVESDDLQQAMKKFSPLAGQSLENSHQCSKFPEENQRLPIVKRLFCPTR